MANRENSSLEKEKEINGVQGKRLTLEKQILEHIREASLAISAISIGILSVQEFPNNSNSVDNSALNNDTIMHCEQPSVYVSNEKKEECVIMSDCDLFDEATVTNSEEECIDDDDEELYNLLEARKQLEDDIKTLQRAHEIAIIIDLQMSMLQKIEELKRLEKSKKNWM